MTFLAGFLSAIALYFIIGLIVAVVNLFLFGQIGHFFAGGWQWKRIREYVIFCICMWPGPLVGILLYDPKEAELQRRAEEGRERKRDRDWSVAHWFSESFTIMNDGTIEIDHEKLKVAVDYANENGFKVPTEESRNFKRAEVTFLE